MVGLIAGLVLGACSGEERPASLASSRPDPAPAAETTAPTRANATTATGVLQVDVLDVGQGDAILLRTPGAKAVLIDAGTGQVGEAALPLLQEIGVNTLDLVVATHPHADHIGGMDEVLGSIPARLLIDNGLPHSTDTYDKLMKLVETKGIKYKSAKAGQIYRLDGGVKLEVLNPTGDPITGTRSDLNANSVVVRATHGKNCFLFTGDAEAETEERLLANKVQPCDVLKAAHHGSRYASSTEFLAAVKPQAVLISLGAGNEYGHPDPEAVARYEATKASIFRTDQDGNLHAESDGTRVVITPTRGQPKTITGRSTPSSDGGSTGTSTASAGEASGLLNLNTATAAELEALPGVGEKLAAAIIDYRAKNGPFRSVSALDEVPGVGPSTLAQLEGLVRAAP